MSNSANNYNLLISKLDQFIRKYYLNQLLRGVIYTSTLLLALFLAFTLTEYFFFLPTIGRKVLFYGYLAITAGVFINWIALPLMHYLMLGQVISHEQAADIIGKHFTNVQDRLLNILQLKRQSEGAGDKSLIMASINQKIEDLKPVPFTAAIDLGQNKRFLKYLAIPALVLVVLLVAAPSVIRDGSTRLIRNSEGFEKPAPFQFNLKNQDLTAIQYTDFDLELEMTGDVMPDQVFVEQGGYNYKMKRNKEGRFTYTFSNLQKSLQFNFTAAGFNSRTYDLEVVPKPMILAFDVALDYPEYTGKKDELLSNIGDLSIPEGTKVIWDFNTTATSDIRISLGDSIYSANRQGKDHFTFVSSFKESSPYTLKVSGDGARDADSIAYNINVQPDQYPSISLNVFEDSTGNSYIYFTGEVGDDYGLRSLAFKYKVDSDKAGESKYQSVPIKLTGNKISSYSHYWELSALGLKPGERVNYFFEVWDNDAVNGSKSSRSTSYVFRMPSKEELDEKTDQKNEEIKDKLADAMDQAKDVQEKIKDIKDKTIGKKNLSWEDKKAVEDLMKQQQELEKTINDLKNDVSQNMQQQQQYKEMSEAMKEKQDKLQELFDQVMNDEMKELFEKLESLMEQMDKQQLMEQMEDMELTDEQLEKELDRMLELFKKFEMEQKLEETIAELDKLGDEQQKLAEDTENKTEGNEELKKKQEELNKKFDEVTKDMQELDKMNQELGENMDFDETMEQMEQTDQEMDEGTENLSKNNNKKASQNQKNAAEQMKKMSESLAMQQQSMQMEQMQMDMKALRQLLENLVQLSFDQENLMDQIKLTDINNPQYVKLVQEQKKLKDDAEMVEDSLYALAKKLVQIESFVTQEITEINRNIAKGIERLEQRDKNGAQINQQLTMTGFNNLALMFTEVMDQMQQQMSQMMPGMSQCQKPGNNPKPSMSMSQMQQQLNEQIKQMQEGMKKGKKPGEKGEGGEGGMSKELAKAAAQQKAIREALQKLAQMEQQKNGENGGLGGELEELIKEMDKTETQLVNKQLTEEMVKRQQEILTKLLDAEKAMKEREYDDQRKSNTADEMVNKMPPSLEEYMKKREAEIQLYKTVPPSLKPYYKNLVETYFKNISF